MTIEAFLKEFVIILAAAVVVTYVSHRLRIPAVVGFLLTGLLIGPSAFSLVAEQSQVDLFAEIGVVILLFSIGLEFSLDRVKQIQRAFFVGGSLQALLTTSAVAFISIAIGLRLPESIFWGFLVTMSSTAIVLRLYSQRHELESPHGKLSIGVLLFQDMVIVLMIFLTPVLGGTVAISVQDILIRFVGGIVLIAAVFVLARYLMPQVLHAIVRTQVREMFVLGALTIALGLALLTAAFEFSLALGAFLAGLIFSESEYSPQVVAEVAPFRDVFSSMFFIAVGMLLDLEFVHHNLPNVLGMGFLIFVLKAVIVLAIILWMKFPWRIGVMAAIGLAQIGEFSFVLARVGQAHGLVDEPLFQTFLASSFLTMLVTPLLINAAPRIAEQSRRVVPWETRQGEIPLPVAKERLTNHVVIVGYGLNGANLARVLSETAIPYVIIELNGETVRAAKQQGQPIVYGDATRRDILELCAVQSASVIVFAISDPLATRQGVKVARVLNPSMFIIVRTRYVAEVDVLKGLGANEVIPEEFETSIEIFTRVLERYHIPRNVINGQIRLLRAEAYHMLRASTLDRPLSDKLIRWLAAGTTEIFFVEESSPAAAKTIAELDLNRYSGARIIAVVRGETSYPNPSGDFQILADDSLVLVGNHADIEKAFQMLEGKPDL